MRDRRTSEQKLRDAEQTAVALAKKLAAAIQVLRNHWEQLTPAERREVEKVEGVR